MALTPHSMPVVAIVGRANVGKSTLFNRLIGDRQAITHDAPGTTRDPNIAPVTWGAANFWLVDTAGLKTPEDDFEAAIREQVEEAATSADCLVVVLDAATIITTEDQAAVRLARKTGKPLILVLNKIDTARRGAADEFTRLGAKTEIETSAVHGTGTGDLLDAIAKMIKKTPAIPERDTLRLAIIGRPNVGKSSLLNSIAGKQQAIVSERAGTTRDAGSATVTYHGQAVELIDTAGLRRRGSIERGVEQFSGLRTLSAISRSDISVLVMDATEAAVAGDQHIAGMVLEAGKGLILVVNKWDAIEKDDKTMPFYIRRIQREFAFAPWAPVLFVSAETGLNVTKLMELAQGIHQRRQTTIPTTKLNTLLRSLVAAHPPAGLKNRQPKLNYVTQTDIKPPTFTFFGSYPNFLHFSYRRYIENGLREAYDFTGTPIRLQFKSKRGETP